MEARTAVKVMIGILVSKNLIVQQLGQELFDELDRANGTVVPQDLPGILTWLDALKEM